MSCLENRVKDTLAYFCDFDSTKSTESVKLDSGGSPSKPRGLQELLKRIRTFSQMTWFAKPDWLSPVNCSRLGWQNIDVDLLECVTCKTILSAKLPSSHNIQVYDECCKRLEFLLQNGHHSCCPWKSRPTASDLCQLTLRNRSNELQDFIGRVQGLTELKSHLPVIEDAAFTCLKLTMDDIVHLCHVVTDVSPCFADVDYSVLMSACVLALCGWHVSASASCSELVECKFCDRKIGLWNYFSQNPEVDQETMTTIMSCYDDGDLAVNELGNCTGAHFSRTESPFACDLIAVAQESNHQMMNRNQELSGEEGTNGGLNGVQTEQSNTLTDEENPASRLSQEEKEEEEEDVPAALTENVQLELPKQIGVTDVSHEVLVLGNLFSGSEKEQILDGEDVRSIQSLTGTVLSTADVPSIADALCSTEIIVADEEVPSAHMTNENAGDSGNQESVVLNDIEFDIDCRNSGSSKCQDDNVFSSIEVSQECYAKCNVECEEESADVNLMCSIEGFSGKLDSSVVSSSNSFSASIVNVTQHNLSDAGVRYDSVRDDMTEDIGSVSGEIVMDRQKEGGLTGTLNTLASETIPSMSNNVTLTSDGQVIGAICTTSVSDEHSGSQEVQLTMEDEFRCGPAAASAADLDSATEERSNIVPEKLMESYDKTVSCNRFLCEGNLFKSESNGSNKPDTDDLSTNQLTDQLTDQQPGQPTTQPTDEPTDQLTNQLTAHPADQPITQATDVLTDQLIYQLTDQSAGQPGQPTTQQTNEPTDQLTNQLMEQLTDQPTATDVVELQAYNEDDVEPHFQGSMKRTSTAAPEETKVSAKRRCLARPTRVHFNPVAEHRPWCIWVQDAVTKRCQKMAGGNEEAVEDGTCYSAPQKPWIRLFCLLLQSNPPGNRVLPRALQAVRSVLESF